VLEEYENIVPECDLGVIQASASITEQQRQFRELVSRVLETAKS
jgi:hypothetical protein